MELQVKYSKTAFFSEVHLRNFNMLMYNITLQERDVVCRVPQTYLNYVNPVSQSISRVPQRAHLEKPWIMEFATTYLYRNHVSRMVAE